MSSSPAPVACAFCHIRVTNSRKKGRFCSKCNSFWHLSCARLTRNSSAALSTWHCRPCLSIESVHAARLPSSTPLDADTVLKTIFAWRKHCRIPVKIPRSCRIPVADILAQSIDKALDNNSEEDWSRLASFAPLVLGLDITPNRPDRETLSAPASIRRNIGNFTSSICLPSPPDSVYRRPSKFSDPVAKAKTLRSSVNRKLIEGDIAAAVRVVASDASILEVTPDVLHGLQLKHPPAPVDTRPIPDPVDSPILVASEDDVLNALKSFAGSSSGGVDALRPGHIKDLIGPHSAEAGARLRRSVTALVNRLLAADISDFARRLLFSANLTALRKKDGGIRPIAVGNVFRRIASNVACRSVTKRLANELAPIQLGVGIRNGCESAVHAARTFIQRPSTSQIMIKLDMRNAFNCVRRDSVLETCLHRAPSLYRLAHLAYSQASSVLADGHIINSCTGVQQGDPLGPILFALAVDDAACSPTSKFNVWYLDDATIAGDADSVISDVRQVLPALARLGLEVNPTKSELINLGLSSEEFERARHAIEGSLAGVTVTPSNDVELLGSPISLPATARVIESKVEHFQSMTENLRLLDAHPALFLLKNCFAVPRLLYTLRSSPCYAVQHLSRFDDHIRASAEHLCNISFDDPGWAQAKLPIRAGGIGLRTATDLALPAYLSSRAASRDLVQRILHKTATASQDDDQAAEEWRRRSLAIPDSPNFQKNWDDAQCKAQVSTLRPTLNQHRLACLSAAAEPCSGAWLQAVPASSTGTLLDGDSVRIGIAQRLGLQLCQRHRCRCGGLVDKYGLHPLSCRYSAGRLPRHAALNDTVKRGLEAAGFPAHLEPVGLDRGDGKRPDGITIFPFKVGKSLIWDATCSDTFATGSLIASAVAPGSAAKGAEERKKSKYASLTDRYIFQPIAIETAGVFGPSTLTFLKSLGSRIATERGNPREAEYLIQRLSLAVIRGNAQAVLTSSKC